LFKAVTLYETLLYYKAVLRA